MLVETTHLTQAERISFADVMAKTKGIKLISLKPIVRASHSAKTANIVLPGP